MRDGGVLRERFNSCAHGVVKGSAEETALLAWLADVFLRKACSQSMSEYDVGGFLTCMAAQKRREADAAPTQAGRDAALRQAAVMPTTYKQLLTVLRNANVAEWMPEVHYSSCIRSGYIFRDTGAEDEDFRGPGSCPHCPAQEACKRTSFIYLPISEFIRRIFLIPELAQQIGSWKERISTDGTMRVRTVSPR